MLSKKLETALNNQITHEMYSANLYLAAAAYCASIDFDGFANFFRVQAEEETFHAMKFFDFIEDKGNRVTMNTIDKPKNEFDSLEDVFDYTLRHEQKVTALINDLMNLAIKENDHSVQSFLRWFVDEQVEEEATFDKLLKKVKLVGKDGQGLLLLDNELGQRTFSPPAAEK